MRHTYSEKSGIHVIRAILWRPSWISKWPPSMFNLSDILATSKHTDIVEMPILMCSHTKNALEARSKQCRFQRAG